jgi:cyclopropane fatty-acyl-phospholipid synthase-like methyltransferase
MTTNDDPKEIVRFGYDRCAQAYTVARAQDRSPELALLSARLSAAARILDVGCGAGIPVTAALSQMGFVVGVDISAVQIGLASENVPSARFIRGDIMAQDFAEASFDAVVAFYVLFHLPRDEHPELLCKLRRWLRPGGYLLATLARSDQPGYTEPDFFGVRMYWSHYEAPWYAEQLAEHGFEIIHRGVVGSGYRDVLDLPPERHPVVLAQLAAAL